MSVASPPSCPASAAGSLGCLAARLDNSWVAQLRPDPSSKPPNKRAREVHAGHYVLVKPTPLKRPYLVTYSRDVLRMLELSEAEAEAESSPFVRLFSGATDVVAGFQATWATPYALSIYGEEVQPNGAGASGNGYGDGRAISIGEVLTAAGQRWEIQLKGGGATPFCRNADGRAVLRSSVREYLASEAMHHMGVPSTRALSLIASRSDTVLRPWYAPSTYAANANTTAPHSNTCADTDAQCAAWAMLGECGRNVAFMRDKCAKSCELCGVWRDVQPQRHGGDHHRPERCAITTRVATSFLRVGHLELYARRARRGEATGLQELEGIARHALFREYPPYAAEAPLQPQLLRMAAEASRRFAEMAAHWVRVGYTQSNFNSDNCLIGGVTVDFGPFGFIERYEPGWSMWVGSAEGKHFSFMNQPRAAGRNYKMFAQSLAPLLDTAGQRKLRATIDAFDTQAEEAMGRMWAAKLGLAAGEATAVLAQELLGMMGSHPCDYTLTWRQLAQVAERGAAGASDEELLGVLEPAMYLPLGDKAAAWVRWLRRWLRAQQAEAEGGGGGAEAARRMRLVSPKYIPREWMLAEAYTGAEHDNHTALHTLERLLLRPYDEQPEHEAQYYRQAPHGTAQQGGIGFMS